MIMELSVAAATAVVGYDLMTGHPLARSGRHRILRGIGMTGSAAAGDTQAEIYTGERRSGVVYNSGTGFPNRDHIKNAGNVFIKLGDPLRLNITDAPATNPINVILDIQEL